MKVIAGKTTTQTTNIDQVQVSLNVLYNGEVVGMINLSGAWKKLAEQIADKWSNQEPQCLVIPNSFGNKKGYQLVTTTKQLVGFLNYFEEVSSLDVAYQLMKASTFELHKGADINLI